ncbi:MAG TPA: molybdopterin-dependent oxidoreductase [Nitrospira sp.]|nr:molybdopterin-dependent oxidoreductase [Nitrospira sp.]
MDELGFPIWLRVNHFINLFCIFFLMRSGLQILADHPKLYWNDHCRPGSEWLKFGKKKMPINRLFTSLDEAEDVSPVFAIPGGHHNLGAGRNWHFLIVPLWIVNGLSYVALLFATGQWRRLIPTSWSIFPEAWQSALTFASLDVPPESVFRPYDPLQQLVYAAVVFLLGPLMIITGLAQSPAFIARYPWYVRLLGGRQGARSLHFIGLMLLVLYVLTHLAMVVLVHFPNDLEGMFSMFGPPGSSSVVAFLTASAALTFLIGSHIAATLYTRWNQRGFQEQATKIVEPLMRLFFGQLRSHQHYAADSITTMHHVNGYPPEDGDYHRLAEQGFRDWRLRVTGLVDRPLEFSLDDLKRMPKQEQTVMHNCIQGWTGIAKWGGARVRDLLEVCRPKPGAKWIVFHAFVQEEYAPDHYYEAFTLPEMNDPQTIVAYEMNGRPLPHEHGAPCRLRLETKVGYKMVKYLRGIELVASLDEVGLGHGGYREDHQFYDKVASI